jgi:hypothetical protein
MLFEFLASTSEHALIAQLSRGNRRHVWATPLELADLEVAGPELRQLHGEFAGIGTHLLERAASLSDSGFDGEARGLVDRTIRPAYQQAVEGTRRAAAEIDKKAERFFTPEFGPDADPAVQAAQHTWWRGLSMPQQLEAAQDLEIARVAVKFGPAMSGLPFDVFDRVARAMAIEQLAQRIAKDANLRTAPTPNDPIGGAVDMATARANASEAFDRWDGERELLAIAPKTLADFIDATAVLAGESRAAAFQRLSA